MNKFAPLLGGLLLTASLGAAAQDLAAAASSKTVKVLLDNEHVKVDEVAMQPGEMLPHHTHPSGLSLVKKGGKFRLFYRSCQTGKWTHDDSELVAGEALWSEYDREHYAQNIGNSTIEFTEIELKDVPGWFARSGQSCHPADSEDSDDSNHSHQPDDSDHSEEADQPADADHSAEAEQPADADHSSDSDH